MYLCVCLGGGGGDTVGEMHHNTGNHRQKNDFRTSPAVMQLIRGLLLGVCKGVRLVWLQFIGLAEHVMRMGYTDPSLA